ncbi:MAG: hypothetical protein AMXMBFR31_28240 [Candidatus Desulfobacillus denitrificans]|jgi:hypothetical protein|uniref:Ice-binding protein C-terminal domain-containing protein n=1 Tax=Candidatus Desulfobacillus denitrificans TaxID=2608985 RepID=A0A809RBI9_9PROT|nr:hypothetical protein [Rhodocyclaceae bacterium]MCZ2172944.1 PEP-CTERM sorting domain-containing protein [Burkholderiales bacterium]BBO21715.1 conserved hypothetical protein [Candidatus Desulfobacillus denitrificans]GIK45086.1 MAG: hypothetical protein BroJett012_09890 [Betaproteobacteria bacterium]GJQ55742.1 MAG: hypothetical protein HKUEN07_23110 [Rhodocyclaceae bacterium]
MVFGKAMRVGACLLACAAAGVAQADTVNISGFLGGRHAAVDIDAPNNINASAGEFTGTWNGNSFSAMCVDVLHYMNFGTTWTNYSAVTPATYGFTPTQVGLFNRLYTNFYASSHTSNQNAAAFQIAVWEITYDGNGSLNVNAGNFDLGTGGDATARSTAAGWLAGLGALPTGAWSFTVLDSKTPVTGGQAATQDLLVAMPVPEPGTWALLMAGLGLMGLVSRRRLS